MTTTPISILETELSRLLKKKETYESYIEQNEQQTKGYREYIEDLNEKISQVDTAIQKLGDDS